MHTRPCVLECAVTTASFSFSTAFVSSAVGLRGGCLTPHYKDALYTAVMEYIPEDERVEASENEFENGNEELSATDL